VGEVFEDTISVLLAGGHSRVSTGVVTVNEIVDIDAGSSRAEVLESKLNCGKAYIVNIVLNVSYGVN
jgi:hypothetical protein